MNCSECNLYMDLVTLNTFDVNWCYSCNGVWIGEKTLYEILSKTEPPKTYLLNELAKSEGNISERDCPNCKKTKMLYKLLDRVEIDYCNECKGIYFDKGELEQIAPTVHKAAKHDIDYDYSWDGLFDDQKPRGVLYAVAVIIQLVLMVIFSGGSS